MSKESWERDSLHECIDSIDLQEIEDHVNVFLQSFQDHEEAFYLELLVTFQRAFFTHFSSPGRRGVEFEDYTATYDRDGCLRNR